MLRHLRSKFAAHNQKERREIEIYLRLLKPGGIPRRSKVVVARNWCICDCDLRFCGSEILRLRWLGIAIWFGSEMSQHVFWFSFWLTSVLLFFSKMVQLITEPLSMDRFRFLMYWFGSIPVWIGSVQQFGSVFSFFAHP